MKQLVTQAVCQKCGRTVRMKDAGRYWLIEPHKEVPDLYIIRCPEHWTDWALRNTVVGRTNAMRQRMREALAQPPMPFPVHLDPFPVMNAGDRHGK